MTCACGHAEHRRPETREEALALAVHRDAIEALLEDVAIDQGRWMSVRRCRRCGALWAEDSMMSGHAELLFVYPIETGDAVAWLAAARSLRL